MILDSQGKRVSNLSQVPFGVWSIGIATTLMTISSLMIFTLTPLFLKNGLGLPMKDIGTIEGIAEAISNVIRIFSGPISDYFGKRKALVVLGYGLMTIVKPLFAIAPAIGWIVFARFTERVGNGLQGAPREALIGDLAPPHLRGTCFGLRNSLTKVGSVGGAFLTWYLLYTTNSDYQMIFWIAIIPSAIGFFILVFFVKDKEQEKLSKDEKPKRHPIHLSDITRLGKPFWAVMGVVTVFMLSHCNESFITLRAENLGLAEKHLPSVMLVMNAVVVLAAYYSGALSDRLGRKIFLVVGFSAQILALLVLSFAPSWEWVILGVTLWGIQMGTTQSILVTIVVDTTPKDLHGTAFGVFFLISGVSLFFSSHITGALWDGHSPLYAFASCAAIGSVALLLLSFLKLPKIEA